MRLTNLLQANLLQANLLLDTYTFVWWDNETLNLSPRVLSLCYDPNVILYLSLVSLWEIQIKSSLEKLSLRLPLRDLVADHQQNNGLQLLPITLNHILALNSLPQLHRDPFDRLLIAQAQVEAMPLASADRVFAGYPVSIVWPSPDPEASLRVLKARQRLKYLEYSVRHPGNFALAKHILCTEGKLLEQIGDEVLEKTCSPQF